jgi:hypothetical protein
MGAPFVTSKPHFYQADESLVNSVEGLKPNEKEHEIALQFEMVNSF